MVFGVKMAEMYTKKPTTTKHIFKTRIMALESIKIQIGLHHVLSWPKLGLEQKFHEAGTFGGFGKRAQSLSDIQRIFNTGPYGDPP